MLFFVRYSCVGALTLAVLAGCNDQTNKGSGTGGSGAGAAEGAPGVASPIGGATGTKGDGATVGAGSSNTNSSPANPGATDTASPGNQGDIAK